MILLYQGHSVITLFSAEYSAFANCFYRLKINRDSFAAEAGAISFHDSWIVMYQF
jgi:hypothetical protein